MGGGGNRYAIRVDGGLWMADCGITPNQTQASKHQTPNSKNKPFHHSIIQPIGRFNPSFKNEVSRDIKGRH